MMMIITLKRVHYVSVRFLRTACLINLSSVNKKYIFVKIIHDIMVVLLLTRTVAPGEHKYRKYYFEAK